MTEFTDFIISAVPVYNEENLAYARTLIKGEGTIPWLEPYPNSVKDKCNHCGGEVWIGPAQQKRIAETDSIPTILCHFCTVISGYYDGTNLVPLTGEHTKIFEA